MRGFKIELTPDEVDAIRDTLKEIWEDTLEKGGQYGTKNFTNNLSNSFDLEYDSDSYTMNITFADYGQNLQFGGGQGKWPNVTNMRKWVVHRGLEYEGEKLTTSSKEYKINSIAYVVSRKIYEKGVDKFELYQPILDKIFTISQIFEENLKNQVELNILGSFIGRF